MAKLLVIEDDPAILELLALHYTKNGYEVVTAEDGFTGTALAMKEKPDLIILDFNMPAANGAKVHERLRRSTFTAATPVIFLTAVLLPEVIAQVHGDPMTRFVQKPIDFPSLSRMIAELLGAPATPKKEPPSAPAAPREPYDPDDPQSTTGGDILNLD